MDFTLEKYKQLVAALKESGYEFQTFESYLQNPVKKTVILRHDVDAKAKNALTIAKIEQEAGIKSSYYFRVKQRNKVELIKQIVTLGHEIGYHYEDLSLAGGDEQKALKHFEKQLAYFRQFYPVQTICMHGSPMSKYDNRSLWKKYSYQDFGIIGEPYFDVDFNKVLYLTDTARLWNGQKYNIRDKVKTLFEQKFRTTDEIIETVKNNALPAQIMITTHPQRWTDNKAEWLVELISQKIKNSIKNKIVIAGLVTEHSRSMTRNRKKLN